MEIVAYGETFGVSAMLNSFEYEATERGLAIWQKDEGGLDSVSISTWHGVFVEMVDEQGAVVAEGGDGNWCYMPVEKERRYLRYKELPDPKLNAKQMDAARNTVKRYLVSDAPYSLDIPKNMQEAIAWLQGKLEEIPQPCRDTARLRFDTTMEYGETYPNLEITYSEPESDEEVIRRVQVERERKRVREVAEKKQLATLQEKYA